MTFLSVEDLPSRGDIVFCKWPGEPSNNPARRVLVLNSEIRIDNDTGDEFGVVEIIYGSGNLLAPFALDVDLIIQEYGEFAECGIVKPTRFYMAKRRHLLWKDDKFVSPGYIKDQGNKLGRLPRKRFLELNALLDNISAQSDPVQC